ncbi:androgen-dependent TFPI-regulating protein-like isoform X2 [Chiloscyllium plagiosum]|uniref:androgen-dependent TFPI-regulating protein-like isoform X2 n=1 Tax=Chiloscyllium plagiosum TaxID=36176 RepID=UPI001CB863B1|nr:androgen-dependent TFPI-regulating protein-like isoform X2 [Chiloscyllium plagiosum]
MLPTIVSRVYHITTFVWYLLLIYLLLNTQYSHTLPGVFLYAGQWKYLTFLNLFLQTFFNGLSILVDILGPMMWIRSLRDLFFSVLAFPVGTHTVVLPLILLELFNTPHQYPKRRTGLLILGLVSISYLLWVLWIYYAAGAWVYPLLGQFNRLGLVLFFSVSLLLVMLLYLLGEKLTSLIWGLADKTKKHK